MIPQCNLTVWHLKSHSHSCSVPVISAALMSHIVPLHMLLSLIWNELHNASVSSNFLVCSENFSPPWALFQFYCYCYFTTLFSHNQSFPLFILFWEIQNVLHKVTVFQYFLGLFWKFFTLSTVSLFSFTANLQLIHLKSVLSTISVLCFGNFVWVSWS